jgi:hypothetical protein
MKKTVLCHFFNEEYMLPWWLMHHREIFDYGIMINYASTDRSVEIIREYCPDWRIVDSRNIEFTAKLADDEIMDYESEESGWKMCLNVTEFLVGDTSIMNDVEDQVLAFKCYIMVDNDIENNNTKLTYNESLIKQKPFGIDFSHPDPKMEQWRGGRVVHNRKRYEYSQGRHHSTGLRSEMQILWYGYSPMTDEMLDRKLQIQHKMSQSDKNQGFGVAHIADKSELLRRYANYLPYVSDLSKILKL